MHADDPDPDTGPDSGGTPYWRLIAVLVSTLPLTPPLAMRLYRAALDLHRDQEEVQVIVGDLGQGEVRRLGRELVSGAIAGPGFEAELETASGSGRVRFIVTSEGIESGEEREQARDAARRRLMN